MSAKTPRQLRAELAELHEEHDALLDEIFENAGKADLYGESGPEDIAVAYVRRLEAENGRLRQLSEFVDGITTNPEVIEKLGEPVIVNWRRRAGLPS